MKVLLVNKFLYSKGGAETYVIKLGKYLKKMGHDVQYFGMYNDNIELTNDYKLYVTERNFQKKSIKNIFKVLSMINNKEAKRKIEKLLNLYNPDLIILNNIEYHLTPSIIEAIGKYKRKNKLTKLFYVAHDYQLICPSHGLFDNNIKPCELCLNGKYINCFKTKCMKNSKLKSLIATIDSYYWHHKKTYTYIDKIICPSNFMKTKLDTNQIFKNKTCTIHNFVDIKDYIPLEKENYILYFGAFKKDKGVETLLNVCKKNPKIQFVFAGYGPLEESIKKVKNACCVGFKTGKDLEEIIKKAKLSISPSEWYENCPFSVIEAQQYGTPVIGANIGGIPELISINKTGLIFEPGDEDDLNEKINYLWNNKKLLQDFSKNCEFLEFETEETYYLKIMKLYRGESNENL